MSVTLLVKLERPVLLGEIESSSSRALQDLLNLEQELLISAKFDDSDRVGSPSNGFFTASSYSVVCSLAGHQETVAVRPLTVPVQTPAGDGSFSFHDQSYLSITWHVRKTTLCWAMVAAVAVGMARMVRSTIQDYAGFFTNTEEQAPEEFCQALRITTPQTSLSLAAEALYAKMPKSAEIVQKSG
jgi:hypothetical protein